MLPATTNAIEGKSYLQTLPLNSPSGTDQTTNSAEVVPALPDSSQNLSASLENIYTANQKASSLAIQVQNKLDDIDAERKIALLRALDKIVERGVDPLKVIQDNDFNPSTLQGQKSLIQLAVAYSPK